jgi:hypothetical protein
MSSGPPGDWRMIPTIANGQPAAVAYQREPDGKLHAFGLGVLSVNEAGIARIFVFGVDPTSWPHSASQPSITAPAAGAVCPVPAAEFPYQPPAS